MAVVLVAGSAGGATLQRTPVPAMSARSTSGVTPLAQRGPILIQGNKDFTTANGVTGGSGTVANPYTINDWYIDVSIQGGIPLDVENTTAYFVASGNSFAAGPGVPCVRFVNVANGALMNSSALGIPGTNGVDVELSSAVTVRGVYVQESTLGVLASTNVVLQRNLLNFAAIYVAGSSNAVVRDNVLYNGQATGIVASGSNGVTIAANNVSTNSGDGILVLGGSGAAVRYNNLSYLPGSGIHLVSTNLATVAANNLTGNGYAGLYLESSANTTVHANAFVHDGLFLAGSALYQYDTQAVDATNLVNGLPIRFYKDCTSPHVDGISAGQAFFVHCTNLFVSNLTVRDGTAGVTLAFDTGGAVLDTNASGNSRVGILVRASSSLTLVQNTVYANGIGLLASGSSSIAVYHNNILHNPLQAQDEGGTGDVWDDGYPSGGNFWSDYMGQDQCSGPLQNICSGPDGIGDISSWGLDRYPLMRPWGVRPPPPIASFTVPSVVFMEYGGAPTPVDASPSVDMYGTILTYDWDFGDGTTWNITWTSTSHFYVSYGTFRIGLTVTDQLGLTNTTWRTVEIVGYPAPAFTVTPNPGVMNLPMVFNGSSSTDPWGTIVNWTWYLPFVPPKYGPVVTYTPVNWTGGLGVTLTVTDNRSVSMSTSQALSVVMDTSPPSTTITVNGTRGSNGWYVSPVNVTLTARDDLSGIASTRVRVDGGPWRTYHGAFPLGDGLHTVEYRSTDGSGNTETNHTATIAVDTTPPTVQITATSGPVPAGNVVVRWNGSDATSGVGSYDVGVDGGAFVSAGGNTSVTLHLSEGQHTVVVHAMDMAGNRGTDQTGITVTAAGPAPPSGGPNSVAISLVVIATSASVVVLAVCLAVVFLRRRRRADPPKPETP